MFVGLAGLPPVKELLDRVHAGVVHPKPSAVVRVDDGVPDRGLSKLPLQAERLGVPPARCLSSNLVPPYKGLADSIFLQQNDFQKHQLQQTSPEDKKREGC